MELLLGDKAVGLAAIDAGIRGVFSYPGTPATEIFECVRDRAGHNGSVVAIVVVDQNRASDEAVPQSEPGAPATGPTLKSEFSNLPAPFTPFQLFNLPTPIPRQRSPRPEGESACGGLPGTSSPWKADPIFPFCFFSPRSSCSFRLKPLNSSTP